MNTSSTLPNGLTSQTHTYQSDGFGICTLLGFSLFVAVCCALGGFAIGLIMVGAIFTAPVWILMKIWKSGPVARSAIRVLGLLAFIDLFFLRAYLNIHLVKLSMSPNWGPEDYFKLVGFGILVVLPILSLIPFILQQFDKYSRMKNELKKASLEHFRE